MSSTNSSRVGKALSSWVFSPSSLFIISSIELIWEKLPSAQKERVNGAWQDSILSKVTLDKNAVAWIDDKSYEGKEVYLVDFPTKNMGVPNNMLIYADVDTYKYIGNAPVD